MEEHLELPKVPKKKRKLPPRTREGRLAQRCAIAKKTLNLWLSKLRYKYRPSNKETKKVTNKLTKKVTKKPAIDTESSLEDCGSDYTGQEESDGHY